MVTSGDNITKAADIIRKSAGKKAPRLALTLGSGLGAVADLMQDAVTIPYADLPGFPKTGVAGHEGSLRLGTVEGVPLVFLKGRKHMFEGPAEAIAANKNVIRTLKTAGIGILFLTNAAGSLRKEYPPGALVAISDHINLTGTNPLAGPNDDDWGPRFPPMDNAWDSDLRAQLMKAGKMAGVKNLGEGVYCQFLGPTFETPAEIKMAKAIGADTVGMSTVVENIIARHCGLRCIGVSAVTNLAAGMGDVPLSHEQTLEGAKLAEKNMARLVGAFISARGGQT
jgi:xanthosine phosphorylase